MELYWHPYKYYPYELELAQREIDALLKPRASKIIENGIKVSTPKRGADFDRLVYFSSSGVDKKPTLQGRLERVYGNGPNRQSTRYSAHGLHEYKGKFNPQMPKAILNIHAIPKGSRVLDPFCGSGTSLVEAVHLGMKAYGTDINPLAVFLANTKLSSLTINPDALRIGARSAALRLGDIYIGSPQRREYLESWFTPEILNVIERLRSNLLTSGNISNVLLACASNLLRDYSLQDPIDLRIRRRKSPLPNKPYLEAFIEAVDLFASRLESAQTALTETGAGQAVLLDSRDLSKEACKNQYFDCVLTSPPYATALPYIDTQRLSLVWLELIGPEEILPLESKLVGSRETRGEEKKTMLLRLEENSEQLPHEQAEYCLTLLHALGESDGFRRKALPALLYRYFGGMAASFRGVRRVSKFGATYSLVVGGNHTVLGGQRFDIDTPAHLAALAESNGWRTREIFPLQTYQRYGYHANNAVATESIVILEAI